MGSAPAAVAVTRDPEVQEEAMAASPAFGKQVRAAGAEQQLPCIAPAAQADLCPAGQKPMASVGSR